MRCRRWQVGIGVMALAWVASCASGVDERGGGDEGPPVTPAARGGAALELVGLNGRRVVSGDVYWLPFDHPRDTPLWDTHREAMTLINVGDEGLVLEGVWVEPLGDTLPEELVPLAPTHAAERPLEARGVALAPGERLDFDLRLSPRASGLRAATLVVRWSAGADLRVELRGRGAGTLRLYPGASDLAGWRLDLKGGATGGSLPSATLEGGNLYALARLDPEGGDTPDFDVVARATPEGVLQWATALERPGWPSSESQLNALCLGEGVVVAVGQSRSEGGARRLLAHALGYDGVLRWSRSWSPSSERDTVGLRCAIGGGRLWLAAAVDSESGASGADAYILSLSPSRATPAAALVLDPTPHFGDRITALSANDVGAWAGGAAGAAGFVSALHRGWTRRLPAQPLALAARGDQIAAVWAQGDGVTVARFDAEGAPVWARHAVGVWAPARLSPSDEGWLVAATWSGGPTLTRLSLGGEATRGAFLAGPRAAEIAPRALCVSEGAAMIAASATSEGLGASRWYEWSEPWLVTNLKSANVRGAISPAPSGQWRDEGGRVWTWDAERDLSTGPLDGEGATQRGLAVTALPWP